MKEYVVNTDIPKRHLKEGDSVLFVRCNGPKCSQKDSGERAEKSDQQH